jgi:hypothetical protein
VECGNASISVDCAAEDIARCLESVGRCAYDSGKFAG